LPSGQVIATLLEPLAGFIKNQIDALPVLFITFFFVRLTPPYVTEVGSVSPPQDTVSSLSEPDVVCEKEYEVT
jgi:hypothetical protein